MSVGTASDMLGLGDAASSTADLLGSGGDGGTVIGIACAVVGLLISRAWSVSAGGAITLVAAAVVGLAHLVPRRSPAREPASPAQASAGSVVAS